MKASRMVLFVGGVALVTAVSCVSYSDLGTFLFNRGSYVFAMERLSLGITLSVGILSIAALACALRGYSQRSALPVVVLLMMSWGLCGRVVALSWDGRLAGGWFFLRTDTIQLREATEDMESCVKRWRVVVLPGWRLELRAHNRTERLFVGPFLMLRSLSLLRRSGFHVAGGRPVT